MDRTVQHWTNRIKVEKIDQIGPNRIKVDKMDRIGPK